MGRERGGCSRDFSRSAGVSRLHPGAQHHILAANSERMLVCESRTRKSPGSTFRVGGTLVRVGVRVARHRDGEHGPDARAAARAGADSVSDALADAPPDALANACADGLRLGLGLGLGLRLGLRLRLRLRLRLGLRER